LDHRHHFGWILAEHGAWPAPIGHDPHNSVNE
jgi:hypothetical protein